MKKWMKKQERTVWKRLAGMLLCAALLCGMLPLTAEAAATGVVIKDATYYNNGALASITANFSWGTAGAASRLLLMTQKLNDGDLTNFGTYGSKYNSYEEAVADGRFGIISASDSKSVLGGNNTMSISFGENAIPLSRDGMYYVYLWTLWSQAGPAKFYPDNLICAIQVKNGVVQYAGATGPNSYNESDFKEVISKEKYSVTVTPAANMTRVESSGAESQASLEGAMAPVIYTADEGYYFPDTYAVATVNGIMVRRDSESQITVYGTPSANADITLTAPSEKEVEKIYTLNVEGNASFGEKCVGYGTVAPQTITLTNTGNQRLEGLQAALTGAYAASFILDTTAMTTPGGVDERSLRADGAAASLEIGGTTTFTVRPKDGLAAKTYQAQITITATDLETKTVDVTFTVAEHAWDTGKITKKPTTAAAGEKTYTCTKCGTTKIEAVAKLPATTTEKKPETTKTAKTTKTVQTGDQSTPLQWALITAASLAAVAGILVYARKRRTR